MIKNHLKVIALLQLFGIITITDSMEYNPWDNPNIIDAEPLDQNKIQEFDNIYQALKPVPNYIQNFIGMVFEPDKLEDIINSNNINALNNIKNTLNLDFVKNYILENGIGNKSVPTQVDEYKRSFIENKLEFAYNANQSKEYNKEDFRKIYNNNMKQLFDNINKKLNQIKQTVDDLNLVLQDRPNNDINNIKIEILNNVLKYLTENKNNNEKLLNIIQNDYGTVFEEIYNRPLHKLLDVDEHFFKNILDKIRNTYGNEQIQNIYEFVKVITSGAYELILRGNNDTLQTINNILDLNVVKQYFAKDCFYFENSLTFEENIKQEQNRNVNFDDFEAFKEFINEKLAKYIEICQIWNINLEQLEQIEQKTDNGLCINIINKLKQHFNNLQNYCYSQLGVNDNDKELANYFTDRFIIKD